MAEKPIVTIIAGPNGSGKSTLTDYLRAAGIDFGRYINPDEMDKTLPGPPGEDRSRKAQALAEQARRECLEAGASFSFETVMSHPSKVEFLQEARQRGFSVVLYFVALENADLNVERVRQRVRLGGHPVPEDRIRSRYERSLKLLLPAILLCDRAVLFDNSYRSRAGGPIALIAFAEFRRVWTDKPGNLSWITLDADIPMWAYRALPDMFDP